MGNVDFKKVVIAAVAGTAAMTAIMFMAPMMGVPEINIGAMLGGMMSMSSNVGWMMHFVIGIFLTWIYAAFLLNVLPSTGWKRGMIYSLIPWAVMNFMAMPMMGMGIFMGGMMAFVGTVIAHFAYGGVMGHLYGDGGASSEEAPAAEPASEPEPTPVPEPTPEPEPPAEEESSSGEEESASEEESSSSEEESGSGDDEEEKSAKGQGKL